METGETAPEWAIPKDVKTLEKKLALTDLERSEWWPPDQGKHEVTFAIEVETARLEMYDGERDGADAWKKSFDPMRYLTGTIDWLYNDGRVGDLKTGAWEVVPEGNKQLLSYSLVPWITAGMPLLWERDVEITQWPRYPLGALPTRTWAKVRGLQLMEHLEDVRWTLRHTDRVRVAPLRDVPEGKLHPCAGCECREAVPGYSGWGQNFWFRVLPHCAPGLASIAKNLLPED